MKELDMIKAFAELEGVRIVDEYRGQMFILNVDRGTVSINGYSHSSYNPVTDCALTFKALTDYGVDKVGNVYNINEIYHADSMENGDAYAVIECILKSKGLWND